MIRLTTRCLQSPSGLNFCRSKGRIFFRSLESVGCNATAEADYRVYDVMVCRLGWRRRLGANLDIMDASSTCLAG